MRVEKPILGDLGDIEVAELGIAVLGEENIGALRDGVVTLRSRCRMLREWRLRRP